MPDPVGIRRWQLVASRAGRDTGEPYLVCEVGQDGFVFLANGERRRVEAPKRKNARHLLAYDLCAEDLAAKSRDGQQVKNAEVRSALQRLVAEAGLDASEPPRRGAGDLPANGEVHQ